MTNAAVRIKQTVEKRGERWLLVRKNEPAGTPSESAPTGSVTERFQTLLDQPTAQGRESGPGVGHHNMTL